MEIPAKPGGHGTPDETRPQGPHRPERSPVGCTGSWGGDCIKVLSDIEKFGFR